jgi:hypothetical protein
VSERESHVCLLRKTLYGLKQAPRAWYSRIDRYLLQMGFEKSDADPNLYYIIRGEDMLILILYVDDLFITGVEDLIAECKLGLASEFEMSDIEFDALFYGYGGMAGGGSYLPWTGEVCCRYFDQVSNGRLQAYVYSHSHQLEES